MDTPLPSLFLSHGSPMLAVQDSPAGRFPDRLGAGLPRPRAQLLASAHFASATPAVGAAPNPATVHDFGGFPREPYDIRYPVAGAPELATEIASRLADAGLAPGVSASHAIDRGVRAPLRRMYPQADTPVVPLSVNPAGDAAHRLAVGRALAGLRDEGILMVGPGGFAHHLGDLDWQHPEGPMPPWAHAFAGRMRQRLADHGIAALLDWERQAAHARHAHPTMEHLMPLFVALGAAGDGATGRSLHASHEYGSLALGAFAFHWQVRAPVLASMLAR